MAQSSPQLATKNFGGIVTAGHPLDRPPESSVICRDFRILPGGQLRLRSGRRMRNEFAPASPNLRFRRLFEVRLAAAVSWGVAWHFAAMDMGAGNADPTMNNTSRWYRFARLAGQSFYTFYPYEPINRNYGYQDGAYNASSATNAPGFPAICSTRDRVVYYNGLGVRDGNNSRPPFSQMGADEKIRYFGLDCYYPSGPPTVSSAAGGGGKNSILYARTFYVALRNSTTGHVGNVVKAGTVKATDPGNTAWSGSVTINNLQNLKAAWHTFGPDTLGSTTEQSELQYVFFVTMDGGAVPYMLLDPVSMNGPVAAPINATSASLSLGTTVDGSGFLIDVTQEGPTTNHPPRPMSAIAYANGRVYGIPMPNGGVGSISTYGQFDYVIQSKDLSAIVYSSAADDYQNRQFTGVPEESWPLGNKKYLPNGERPLMIAAWADGTQLLVATRSATYILEETADGLHVWRTISAINGCWDQRTLAMTQYGYVWVDQWKQIVLLRNGTAGLEVLSTPYSEITKNISTSNGSAADYVCDPRNQVDRYQLWLGDGTSICHDFILGTAYTTSNQPVTAACTMHDGYGALHHMLGISTRLYTQEIQPDDNTIPTMDEEAQGVYTTISGDWIGQWQDMGDSVVRKEFKEWDIVGDAAPSVQFNGQSPLTLSWFGDLDPTESILGLKKVAQSDTDMSYRAKIQCGNKRWIKLRARLNGHAGDQGASYDPATSGGDLQPNVYGSIWISRLTIGAPGANR